MKRTCILTVLAFCAALGGSVAAAERPGPDTGTTTVLSLNEATPVAQQTGTEIEIQSEQTVVASTADFEAAPLVLQSEVTAEMSEGPGRPDWLASPEPAAVGGMCHPPSCMKSCAPLIGECCDGYCVCSEWGLTCQ